MNRPSSVSVNWHVTLTVVRRRLLALAVLAFTAFAVGCAPAPQYVPVGSPSVDAAAPDPGPTADDDPDALTTDPAATVDPTPSWPATSTPEPGLTATPPV